MFSDDPDFCYTQSSSIINLLEATDYVDIPKLNTQYNDSNNNNNLKYTSITLSSPSLHSMMMKKRSTSFSRNNFIRLSKSSQCSLSPSSCSSFSASLSPPNTNMTSCSSCISTPLTEASSTEMEYYFQGEFCGDEYVATTTLNQERETIVLKSPFVSLESYPEETAEVEKLTTIVSENKNLNVDDHPLAKPILPSQLVSPNPLQISKSDILSQKLKSNLTRSIDLIKSHTSSIITNLSTHLLQSKNQQNTSKLENLTAAERRITLLDEKEIPLRTFTVSNQNNQQQLIINSRLSSSSRKINSHNFELEKRQREPRINPDFLRLYALDTSAKCKGYLPVTDWEIDLYEEELEYQHDCDNKFSPEIPMPSQGEGEDDSTSIHSVDSIESYDSDILVSSNEISRKQNDDDEISQKLKTASLSRKKLWNYVILAPRSDPTFHFSNYIDVTQSKEIQPSKPFSLNTRRKIPPWLNPSIVLENNKKTTFLEEIGGNNGHGYLKGSCNVQFVVKGWCNERWVASS